LQALLEERFGLWIAVGAQVGVFKHAYTHFKITLHAFACQLTDSNHLNLPTDFTWVPIDNLSAYPMGKVARLISRKIDNGLEL
jgi:A/G-specific adenine glycosylase